MDSGVEVFKKCVAIAKRSLVQGNMVLKEFPKEDEESREYSRILYFIKTQVFDVPVLNEEFCNTHKEILEQMGFEVIVVEADEDTEWDCTVKFIPSAFNPVDAEDENISEATKRFCDSVIELCNLKSIYTKATSRVIRLGDTGKVRSVLIDLFNGAVECKEGCTVDLAKLSQSNVEEIRQIGFSIEETDDGYWKITW